MRRKNGKSVYVCHTYYHVYVSILKEFYKPREEQKKATLILSTMSSDFENLKDRVEREGIFENVYYYDEKNYRDIPEVEKYHHPSKSFLVGLVNRIIFTKKYGKYQERYVPLNFENYEHIYVYCDSDPIGYYLNWKHIYYHSVEDGLDAICGTDSARGDNENHFKLKVFLSKKLNWIFIHNGYGKYCLDMEVNDISKLDYPCPYYVEVSRKKLEERLSAEEKGILLRTFVKDIEKIREVEGNCNGKTVVILTEPLCTLDVRKQIFSDIYEEYKKDYQVIFKVHPRDYMNYEKEFPDVLCIDRTVPMEILNFFSDFKIDLVVGVFTELNGITFAKEKVRLGRSFMDKYEDPEIHKARYASASKLN